MKGIYQIPDYKGSLLNCIEQSDYIDMVKIVAGASSAVTIPATARWVIFNATGNFLCRFDDACPADANITDGTAGELNPVVRRLRKANSTLYTTINIYAIQDCVIMLAYYNDRGSNI